MKKKSRDAKLAYRFVEITVKREKKVGQIRGFHEAFTGYS